MTPTIMVVEDEPAVREIMTYVLRRHGYEVIEAADGREARAVELKAQRRLEGGREEIQHPAAQRELAGVRDLVDAAVLKLHQLLDQAVERLALVDVKAAVLQHQSRDRFPFSYDLRWEKGKRSLI